MRSFAVEAVNRDVCPTSRKLKTSLAITPPCSGMSSTVVSTNVQRWAPVNTYERTRTWCNARCWSLSRRSLPQSNKLIVNIYRCRRWTLEPANDIVLPRWHPSRRTFFRRQHASSWDIQEENDTTLTIIYQHIINANHCTVICIRES